MVEIVNRDEVSVHRDVSATVDAILRGSQARPERRRRNEAGGVDVTAPAAPTASDNRRSGARDVVLSSAARESPLLGRQVVSPPLQSDSAGLPKGRGTDARPVRIFPFGVSRNRLEQAINQVRIPATIVRDLREADLVMTLKNYYRQKPQPLRDAEARGISVYVLRANTATQMEHVLSSLVPSGLRLEEIDVLGNRPNTIAGDLTGALEEAEYAIETIIDGGPAISLNPQQSYIRKLQHQLADRYNLASRSRGREPNRFVEISRDGMH